MNGLDILDVAADGDALGIPKMALDLFTQWIDQKVPTITQSENRGFMGSIAHSVRGFARKVSL